MKEVLTALIAVALLFLNFAHEAPSVAWSADLTPYLVAVGTPAPLCEKHPGQHAAHDTTCHLCRLGSGLDLPTPPCTLIGLTRIALLVDYAGPRAWSSPFPAAASGDARAPPRPVASA